MPKNLPKKSPFSVVSGQALRPRTRPGHWGQVLCPGARGEVEITEKVPQIAPALYLG